MTNELLRGDAESVVKDTFEKKGYVVFELTISESKKSISILFDSNKLFLFHTRLHIARFPSL